jgi:DNA-binding transcriptional ArsR family regulator
MNTFAALAEPNRRLLLEAMIDGAKPVNQLVELIGLSQPVVSKHLRILREYGLVTVEPSGQQRLYSINPQPLRELDQWLQPYRQFWADKLDALEAHLNNLPEEGEK